MPDSGRLIHLRTPLTTDSVRVDAGFVAGDEVSSHYDPMIAKLIVQGPTREIAVRKLLAALGDYEIVGPRTNIEFLKRVCQNPAFVAGDVETGFITKQREQLFANVAIAPEVYAQAALGTFLLEATALRGSNRAFTNTSNVGFTHGSPTRRFQFTRENFDGTNGPDIEVILEQTGTALFSITSNSTHFPSVTSHYDTKTKRVISFFPHTRLDTTYIPHGGTITLFQQSHQYRLRPIAPKWVEKALGTKAMANSVLAPMPCKVLRVEVKEGAKVKKDQVLVVIESMKMETQIKSPQDGVIAKIMHQQGVSFSVPCYVTESGFADDVIGIV